MSLLVDNRTNLDNKECGYLPAKTIVINPLQGLLHGNLKPANIFFCQEKSGGSFLVKLGDYGLDKALEVLGFRGQTMTGAKAYRPAFMPRQQALDVKCDRTDLDIWAAAASLYYMLTGRFAREFAGTDPWLALLQTQPIPIRLRNPSIPKALAELIDLALVDRPHIHFKKACSF